MIISDFRLPGPLREVVRQAARVVCPPDIEALGIVDQVVDHYELNLRTFPKHIRIGMCAGMTALELGAALRPRTLGRRFSRLPIDEARAWFEAWWGSPLTLFHQLAKGLKALLALSYWEQPVIKERLQFHPDRWIAEVAKKRLETWGAEIRQHEEMVRAPDPLIRPATLVRRPRHA